VALCNGRAPTNAEIDAYVLGVGGRAEEALNNLALDIARRYTAGSLGFLECDRLMNSLNGWSVSVRDRVLPEPADSIYLAFDAGEYRHQGDSDETDSEAKYTRPMIEEVLKATNAV